MIRRLSAIAVATALAFGLAAPANATVAGAAHSGPPPTVSGMTVVPVQGEEWSTRRHWRGDRRHWRGDRRHWRGDHRRWDRRHYRPRPGIHFHITPPVPRYVQPRRVHRASQAHYRWCQARYRSYRAWDNTFQPYNGPRRQCISPYV